MLNTDLTALSGVNLGVFLILSGNVVLYITCEMEKNMIKITVDFLSIPVLFLQ